MTRLAPVLMVQGTASSVGKSTLVAGLCRLFARRGLRVAPFKAQNMSNNAAVCPGPPAGEIGRAQFAQARAAGIEPSVDLNPILLKPQAGACQLVVRGQVVGTRTAADYFGTPREDLWPVVVDALDRLRSTYDLVVAEGAGSPAEVNLRQRDLVNMRVARHAQAEVVLVGDIDRGGVFASLLGTWEWLLPEERALVRGFVLNKFRGDASLLAPAPALLEERTGLPVLGVVPSLEDVGVPDEDAASLSLRDEGAAVVDIAVLRLPHLANFDEFGLLAGEPGVQVRYVTRPEELRAPDLVIVPGTKATIPDLQFVHASALAERVRWLVEHGTPVLGICGGYQMLGASVRDPLGLESDQIEAPGLGLLPLRTELAPDKRLARAQGHFRSGLPGVWSSLGGLPVEGYEIHVGRTSGASGQPLLQLEQDAAAGMVARDGRVAGAPEGVGAPDGLNAAPLEGVGAPERLVAGEPEGVGASVQQVAGAPEGVVARGGLVAGTYLHGALERAEPRRALVAALAARRGFTWQPAANTPAADPFDRLADVLEASLRLEALHLPAARMLAS